MGSGTVWDTDVVFIDSLLRLRLRCVLWGEVDGGLWEAMMMVEWKTDENVGGREGALRAMARYYVAEKWGTREGWSLLWPTTNN